MKRNELKKCANCDKGMMHDHNISFYRVKIDSMAIDVKGVNQIHGLETYFGGGQQGAVLSDAMGVNPDIAQQVTTKTFLVCMNCAILDGVTLATLIMD